MASKRKKSSARSPCPKRCKVEEKGLIPNFTLPGFHYLGPGSMKANGPPTNTIDAIAKKHDEAYDQTIDYFKKSHDLKQSVEEIKHADEQFLDDMVKTRARTAKEALGKAVGLMGIGIKASVEKSLGYTLYPSFSKIKDNNEADCRIKVRAGDDFN